MAIDKPNIIKSFSFQKQMYLGYSFLDFVSFSHKENDGTAILDRKKNINEKKDPSKRKSVPTPRKQFVDHNYISFSCPKSFLETVWATN